jgi:glycosyltransferase involved in cell wall biosynthesis
MMQPTITLLTCTYNGEKTIQQALEAIADQTDVSRDLFEVLVIDNASSDRTSEIAAATIKQLALNGRVLLEPRLGKINAFLRGIQEAQGQFVSIIDDDNYIKSGFIRHTLEVFSRYPDVGMVGSSNSIFSEQPVPYWFTWTCGYYACSQPWLDDPKHIDSDGVVVSQTAFIPGAGSTFRVKPLLNCLDKGYSFFNNTLRGKNMRITGEDLEVCCLLSSMGYQFAFNPRIQIDHAIKPDRLSLKYFKVLCKTMGAGSLGIDPFLFTHKVNNEKLSLKWTWQWQLLSKLRLYFYLLVSRMRAFTEEQKFLNWRERTKCIGAIQRILLERDKYTKHIRQVAAGEWTELRIR